MNDNIPNDYIECDCGDHMHYLCVTHDAYDDWPCWLDFGEVIIPSRLPWFGEYSRLGFVWKMLRGKPLMVHSLALTTEAKERLLKALSCDHHDLTNEEFQNEWKGA